MRQITLHPPEVRQTSVTFRWSVKPESELYRKSEFTLNFPDSVDVSAIPEAVWWSVLLTCLHCHWPLLRPCTIRLPVRLPPGQKAVWERLVEVESWTLDAYRHWKLGRQEGAVVIVDDGPILQPCPSRSESDRCATAFSGGKDGLLQVGLLTELTPRPVLVAVTSPMPPLEDHLTVRRQEVFRAITARRDVTFVEVKSDYRQNWDNEFADRLGYPIGINQITDAFLYFGALLASATALGANHLFLAGEAEVQHNIEHHEHMVLVQHYMYSGIVQRTLQGLLTSLGIHYSSLISPLHDYQVQRLLWTRYADLRDLQYSCWSVRVGQAACSRCTKCLRVASGALAIGDSPARVGIDSGTLFRELRQWRPLRLPGVRWPTLPDEATERRVDEQIVQNIRGTSTWGLIRTMLKAQPWQFLRGEGWDALGAFWNLRRALANEVVDNYPGYYAGYLAHIDPLLRQPLTEIFSEHFRPANEADYADALERSNRVLTWMLKPLTSTASEYRPAA